MAYSQAWLENTAAIKGIFVEITRQKYAGSWGTETIYLSTVGYITESADVSFEAILAPSVSMQERMSVDGGLSFSFGDLEVLNLNGELDSWLDSSQYIWVNGTVKVYYGDPMWVTSDLTSFRTDFLKIFDGAIEDIDSKNRTSLNIKIRDKMEWLNSPVTEDKLGVYGTWGASAQPNADTVKPLVFGEVFNTAPLLIDPSTLQYMYNNGTSELLIEIRDNGVPIYTDSSIYGGSAPRPDGATVHTATGKFELSHPLAGGITVSVQGVNNTIDLTTGALVTGTYTNNIANIVALIVTQYGKSTTRLTASDLDLINFYNFAASNTHAVGVLVDSGDNVLSVCQKLVDSIGAQLYFNRTGQLQILRLGSMISGTITTIGDTDIVLHTLSVSSRVPVIAAAKISYCKNWSVQENLLTGIPEAHKDIFATEWYTKTIKDAVVQSRYKLLEDPQPKETMLIKGTEASGEAARLVSFFSTPRTIYKFTGTSRLLSLKLGQGVTLTHNRFGLSGGVSGQVYSLAPNWLGSTVEVEVII